MWHLFVEFPCLSRAVPKPGMCLATAITSFTFAFVFEQFMDQLSGAQRLTSSCLWEAGWTLSFWVVSFGKTRVRGRKIIGANCARRTFPVSVPQLQQEEIEERVFRDGKLRADQNRMQ